MKKGSFILLVSCLVVMACQSPATKQTKQAGMDSLPNHKLIIYQMMTRLFGNKNTTNKYYGSREENGSGKFNDITGTALDSLKALGITHVWYTGVLEHATMADYRIYDIKADDPDVVKGRAGSPYAIKDYYDVDPDLAVDVKNRMQEFDSLIKRTHDHGLKVIMDFIPNHVARTYHSNVKPAGAKDFGEADDKAKSFSPTNDFYYIQDKSFAVPKGVNAGGDDFRSSLKDGRFDETPAKATGNNVFSASPSIDDWYETIKLNYGVDYQNKEAKHFDPVPPLWFKMRDILVYWANKNIDGFRCDMAEMVPVEFWEWVIPQVKKVNPAIIFLAEAYNPAVYQQYITQGKFDYLYDKVGLYDGLKRLIKNDSNANVADIVKACADTALEDHMLRFLENHDEERVASKGFAQDGANAIPAMIVSATLSGGPVMIYFGQEVGETGSGKEGFGGDDNRTTMFDYWGVPAHQQWMNDGKFDGALLSPQQMNLRAFYASVLHAAANNNAIRYGKLNMLANDSLGKKTIAYIRYTPSSITLVAANFDRQNPLHTTLQLPATIATKNRGKAFTATDLLSGKVVEIKDLSTGVPVDIPPMNGVIFELENN